ncbi:MAG: phosphatidylethanolamine/phosphatidyl-N-methylethanolamine N-methyltransferase [Mycobacterium sp.]|jgi:phosphatidylethanolamine/phosphatidyl-N-methylethanolamine N-methyltransferase|nr:phosphatidylethanolamine/phosphatidyl-N-methylethanolamine N-methyltransferase [Mycobacterium sp.]MDT5192741.1 phosphatidylethanolamine/phosphatidyl-N-methylethanolamine N-methyltransferase [Mycobacterium sp.]MDT5195193.1 phosphatidylethanolamine/phosphatidyl-N-methylethanolamine N-methyltransferase [Mycobacterium sp.]MDT5264499.1 phosphatidylethanolamine/phosphatidyl-N-methylethanolamine N-methyltransferase [Mycobacterium sp.]MDT5286358.1 phosphatidylethanolamine/phosphatidyl-N-methylethano
MTSVAGRSMLSDAALLVREFARQPSVVGALAPSSPHLAAAITATIPRYGDPVVVELGPGTGSFTAAIQDRLGTRGRHIAVELNPRLATLTASRHRRVDMVRASADRLPQILDDRGISHADLIISGLPWVSMPASVAEVALDAVTNVLAPSGAFTTFGYTLVRGLAPGRRFRSMLTDRFEEVVIGRTVMRNLPPAFVYYARRPGVAPL